MATNDSATQVRSIYIRRYTTADRERVREIFYNGMRADGRPERWLERNMSEKSDMGRIAAHYNEKRNRAFFVAVAVLETQTETSVAEGEDAEPYAELCEEYVVGCVGVEPSKRDARVAVLRRMNVDSAFRRRGIGTALLEAVMSYALEKRFRVVKLCTVTKHDKAVKLYEKNGFELTGTRVVREDKTLLFYAIALPVS